MRGAIRFWPKMSIVLSVDKFPPVLVSTRAGVRSFKCAVFGGFHSFLREDVLPPATAFVVVHDCQLFLDPGGPATQLSQRFF